MTRCKICKEFIYDSLVHKCLPKWQTHIPDYDGENDWVDIYAYSSECAATKRAKEYDDADYGLLDGDEIEIHIKDIDGNIIKYTCTGTTIPEYHATIIH